MNLDQLCGRAEIIVDNAKNAISQDKIQKLSRLKVFSYQTKSNVKSFSSVGFKSMGYHLFLFALSQIKTCFSNALFCITVHYNTK